MLPEYSTNYDYLPFQTDVNPGLNAVLEGAYHKMLCFICYFVHILVYYTVGNKTLSMF